MTRLALVALCGLLPFAVAQEPAQEPPAPKPGAAFHGRFDLDKDGRVTFEEFQRVRSGFAALDADGDGAVTEAEAAKAAERREQRIREAMQRRMQQSRRGARGRGGPWGGRGRGGRFAHAPGGGPGPCPWCMQQPGPRGPGHATGQRRGMDRPGFGPPRAGR
jgi:hypothetical protein